MHGPRTERPSAMASSSLAPHRNWIAVLQIGVVAGGVELLNGQTCVALRSAALQWRVAWERVCAKSSDNCENLHGLS